MILLSRFQRMRILGFGRRTPFVARQGAKSPHQPVVVGKAFQEPLTHRARGDVAVHRRGLVIPEAAEYDLEGTAQSAAEFSDFFIAAEGGAPALSVN